MSSILSRQTQRSIINRGMQALYGIAADNDCDVADVIDLLITTSITSSSGAFRPILAPQSTTPNQQPASSSRPQAAAASTSAQVDAQAGEGPSPSSAHLTQEPQSASATAQMRPDTNVSSAPTVGFLASLAGAEGIADQHLIPESQLAETQSEAGAAPGDEAAADKSASASASAALRISDTQKLRECVAEHPDWPASKIAEATGIKRNHIYGLAKSAKIKLANSHGYFAAQKAKVTEALKAEAEASAQQPAEQPPATIPEAAKGLRWTIADRIRAYMVDHPDATSRQLADALQVNINSVQWAATRAGIQLRRLTPEEHSEACSIGALKGRENRPAPVASVPAPILPERDATDVLHVIRRPPSTARFYIRDSKGRYLHQSLEPSPTDDGPLMTSNRKWAWFDNAQRYAGACRMWPEIGAMRQEAPNP